MEDNKLIAEFMGVEFNANGDKCNHPLIAAPWPPVECLKYHTSWDWLMPVVEKIEALGHCVDIYNHVCVIPHLKKQIAETKIEAVYSAVTQFINHYNKQSN